MIGRVIWFDIKKGFGFIQAGKLDVFVHYSKIVAQEGEFRVLEENDVVEFEVFYSDRSNGTVKPQAKDVKILEDKNEILREKPDNSQRRLVN